MASATATQISKGGKNFMAEDTDAAFKKSMEEMQAKAHETANQTTGACVYNAGGKTYCAVLTQGQCGQLHGIWYAGRHC
jgi:hypothetical protein